MTGLRSGECEEVSRGDPESAACSVYVFQEGELGCVESLNRASDHMLARRLLTGRVSVTPEQAGDASFDLKSLL